MLGLKPVPRSITQREAALGLCAEALATPNNPNELNARARTRRRVRMDDSLMACSLHSRCRSLIDAALPKEWTGGSDRLRHVGSAPIFRIIGFPRRFCV